MLKCKCTKMCCQLKLKRVRKRTRRSVAAFLQAVALSPHGPGLALRRLNSLPGTCGCVVEQELQVQTYTLRPLQRTTRLARMPVNAMYCTCSIQ